MSRLEWLTNLFPLWVLLTAIVALLYPPLFLWVSSDLIVWILMTGFWQGGKDQPLHPHRSRIKGDRQPAKITRQQVIPRGSGGWEFT
ncbi:tsr1026 [Thermosynechococcus vestitus BP-1]|uniref:Tsr1026 protein n=1 Tax=Thermosynechococcus vestitus (strain NIES-2133 / IAM M-273 / BP-1) TaxID=197221 RepID=Q8DK44_THEVB|nr:tsr1026 [Thermosynechococcus vestitus BP-1]